jgi:hypothetical protein
MWTKSGLILNFVGVAFLLFYSTKTEGATTKTDKDYLTSPWIERIGYILLAIGFLLQLLGVDLDRS